MNDNDITSGWKYLLAKAQHYIKIGPDLYNKQDAFDLPAKEWDNKTFKEIESCFKQFIERKGLSIDNPVENISVKGFYASTATLHFALLEQRMETINNEEKFFIDRMIFEHIVDKTKVEIFNKIDQEEGLIL